MINMVQLRKNSFCKSKAIKSEHSPPMLAKIYPVSLLSDRLMTTKELPLVFLIRK